MYIERERVWWNREKKSKVAATAEVEEAEGEDEYNGLKGRDNLKNNIVHEGNGKSTEPLPPERRPQELEPPSPRLLAHEPLLEEQWSLLAPDHVSFSINQGVNVLNSLVVLVCVWQREMGWDYIGESSKGRFHFGFFFFFFLNKLPFVAHTVFEGASWGRSIQGILCIYICIFMCMCMMVVMAWSLNWEEWGEWNENCFAYRWSQTQHTQQSLRRLRLKFQRARMKNDLVFRCQVGC